jgi:hypothetical protein
MKHCPSCKTNYADDTLQFCLQDGTQLTDWSNAQTPTIAFNNDEEQTVVRNQQPSRITYDLQDRQTAGQNPEQHSQVTHVSPQHLPPPTRQKSNTPMIVLLTALAMLLLFGAGVGAWLFLGDRLSGKRDFPTPTPTPTRPGINTSPSASTSPTPSPTASTAPSKTPDLGPKFDDEEVKSEVSDEMYAWKESMESGDLDSVMSHYASTLDYYYKGSNTSSAAVRSNKRRAFEIYDTFQVTIGNMTITPSSSIGGGQKATVVFNKSWTFEGSDDRSSGTVRSQFQLTKIGGRWYITGEKDL